MKSSGVEVWCSSTNAIMSSCARVRCPDACRFRRSADRIEPGGKETRCGDCSRPSPGGGLERDSTECCPAVGRERPGWLARGEICSGPALPLVGVDGLLLESGSHLRIPLDCGDEEEAMLGSRSGVVSLAKRLAKNRANGLEKLGQHPGVSMSSSVITSSDRMAGLGKFALKWLCRSAWVSISFRVRSTTLFWPIDTLNRSEEAFLKIPLTPVRWPRTGAASCETISISSPLGARLLPSALETFAKRHLPNNNGCDFSPRFCKAA